MFERFTDRARRVIVLAQGEARRLEHAQIGAEHLLLGLIDAGDGVAVRALHHFGVPPATVRADVEARLEPGEPDGTDGHIPFAARAKKVLELSLREAIELGHRHIGTEHFLLALLGQPGGIAADVLREHGIEHDPARRWIAESAAAESAAAESAGGEAGRIEPGGGGPGERAFPRGAVTLREQLDRIESRLADLTTRLEILERRVQE